VGNSADAPGAFSGGLTQYHQVPVACNLLKAVLIPNEDYTASQGLTLVVANSFKGANIINRDYGILSSTFTAGKDWSANIPWEVSPTANPFITAGTNITIKISGTGSAAAAAKPMGVALHFAIDKYSEI
jgi:hypothetical protein